MKTPLPLLIVCLSFQILNAQVVDIPDPVLHAAVRQALKKPQGDITVADMESLIELRADMASRGGWPAPMIRSLEGLQAARNLTLLDLSGMEEETRSHVERRTNLATSDLSPLAGLRSLTNLNLSLNDFTNVALPTGLSNLKKLDLSRCRDANPTFHGNLPRLEELNLDYSRLSDLNSLKELSSLRRLNLSTALQTASTLTLPSGLTNLTWLDLSGNFFSGLEFPEPMYALTNLNLSRNSMITNLSALERTPNLNQLDLDFVRLEDYGVLSNLRSLSRLSLRSIYQTTLTIPSGMTNLTSLDLHGAQIRALTLPTDLLRLTELRLGWNQLTNLAFLQDAPNLSTLDLSYNNLSDLSLPAGLIALTNLSLATNSVPDLTTLTAAPNLVTLDLSESSRSSLLLPAGLDRLSHLNLSRNSQLTDLQFLAALPNLQELIMRAHGAQSIALPEGMENLQSLDLQYASASELLLPTDMVSLTDLLVGSCRQLQRLIVPEELTNLQHISATNAMLTEVLIPSSLTRLTTLDLSHNRFGSFDLPVTLTNLTTLEIQDNQWLGGNTDYLTSLTALEHLDLGGCINAHTALPTNHPNLRVLDLEGTRLAGTVDPVSLDPDWTNLIYLNLSDTGLRNLTVPHTLTNLNELILRDIPLTNLTAPSTLNELRLLDVSSTQLTHLELPQGLHNLTSLALWLNPMESLELPNDMTNLTHLYAGHTPLTNVTLPDGMLGLKEIDLTNAKLSEFGFLENLIGLESLSLINNDLTNLLLPQGLYALHDLDLRNNSIDGFDFMQSIPSLNYLNLGGNGIASTNLSFFHENLSFLELNDNLLTDLSVANGLPNLTELDLRDNPLNTLVLPPDQKDLAYLLFYNAPLTELTVPEGFDAQVSPSLGGVLVTYYPVSQPHLVFWDDPAAIVFGTALSEEQLNATATVPGTFEYDPPLGMFLGADANQLLQVTFTPVDTASYDPETTSVFLSVMKADQWITFEPVPDRTYPAAPMELNAVSDSGLAVNLEVVSGPATLDSATLSFTGAGDIILQASQPGNENYFEAIPVEQTFTVHKAVPVITWEDPSPIVYGTALSQTQLNATASVPGSLVYAPPLGTVLDAGADQFLQVAFTPDDATNYESATVSVSLTVTKAEQVITFEPVEDQTYGAPPIEIIATADSGLDVSVQVVSGPATLEGNTLTLAGAGTIVLNTSQAGNSNYLAAIPVEQTFTVHKAVPEVTWATPNPILHGTALSETQLNATASVPGGFVYDPPSGSVLDVGVDQLLQVTWTPDDAANYESATASVTLTVTAPPTITVERNGDSLSISWGGVGVLEWAPSVQGPWTTVDDLVDPYEVVPDSTGSKFYRVRQ